MNEIARIKKNEVAAYTSLDVSTVEGKKAVYNMTQGSAESIADHINETIDVINVYAERQTIADTDDAGNPTGVERDVIRTILVATDGTAYSSCSTGIASSLGRILEIFGEPSEWQQPLTVKVKRMSCKRGQTFILEVV